MTTGRRSRSVRTRLRWLALGAALAATATATVITAPASNAATVGAQLSLTGVAYAKSPTGGSTVGVHPGDTVSFSASALPTAGAGPLSGLLAGLAGALLGFEVDIPAHQLPGVNNPVKLVRGNHCSGGLPSIAVHYPNKGTFSFTYTVRKFVAPATPLTPCVTSQIKLNGSQIADLTHNHIAINATTTYTVHVVVASNPPSGGIPVQIPSVVVGGHAGPVTLPTVKVGVPQGGGLPGQAPGSANGGKPVAGGGVQNGRGGAAGDLPDYNGVPETVPEMAVPHGDSGGGSGDGTSGGGAGGGGGGAGAAGIVGGAGTANLAPTANGEQVATAASDSRSPSAPTGLLLASAAGLVVVAAGYVRFALARRG